MYNYSYVVYDPVKDTELEAELRAAGFTVQREGRKVYVIGSDKKHWDKIRKEADGFWGY